MRASLDPAGSDHRVVIVGGGFGGLLAARGLDARGVRVTLVDRLNHHLFQPLLYQVATGGLSPANIAAPLRALLRSQKNTRVLMADVTGFDLDRRSVLLDDGDELAYDSLIVAAGAGQSYFGHREWAQVAPGLKSVEDATKIRRRVLLAFEEAERETDPRRIEELLTFVVVGGGPTGVELAGALAEVAYRVLRNEFRHIDPRNAKILLVEGLDRVLSGFDESLSRYAKRALERLGVEVRLGTMVESIEPGRIAVRPTDDEDAARETIRARNVLWAAGVQASPLGAALADGSDAELDRAGRVRVAPDCSLPGRPEVFVIGDLARYEHQGDDPLPGLAPVAMQQGRYVARLVRRRLHGKTLPPFRYDDRGSMATIGRKLAVAEIGGLKFGGFVAWLAWLFIHLIYLAEFQNRILVLIQWGWNYLTRNRSARLITAEPRADQVPDARAAPAPATEPEPEPRLEEASS